MKATIVANDGEGYLRKFFDTIKGCISLKRGRI